MSFLNTAFFVKNLPGWERALRIVVALAALVGSLLALPAPWNWIVALGALGFGLSGVVGFCPACALVGRRLAKRA